MTIMRATLKAICVLLGVVLFVRATGWEAQMIGLLVAVDCADDVLAILLHREPKEASEEDEG